MRNKAMTARPAARKGSESRTKKTVAVASVRRSEPMIQMVERRSSANLLAGGAPTVKKQGELPTPTSTFVF